MSGIPLKHRALLSSIVERAHGGDSRQQRAGLMGKEHIYSNGHRLPGHITSSERKTRLVDEEKEGSAAVFLFIFKSDWSTSVI